MLDKLNSILYFFDVGDIKFFFLVARKNLKNLLILTFLISALVLFISLNLEKKYISQATIVISPEENNIVNIEEVYALDNQAGRVNNQIAILKSDEVLEYIVGDKKNIYSSKTFTLKLRLSFLKEYLKNKLI